MNPSKFSYIRNQGEKAYVAVFARIKSWTKSFEVIRLAILLIRFSFNMVVYLYYVNRSSTAGYFYGEAQDEKESAEFNYNITKLTSVRQQSELWNTLLDQTKMKTVDLKSEFIVIYE